MKKLLFVMNTMGQGGAEVALLELLRNINQNEYSVDLFILTGQGELIGRLPKGINLLNKKFIATPVLDPVGRKYLKRTVLKSLFKRANCIRLFPYLVSNLFRMIKSHKIMADKLLWRVLSDGAARFDTEYDLAVSYIEGGSAYYVSDHVKAKAKAAFIHVDYNMAGYSRKLDKDCYLKDDMVFGVSDEVKSAFLSAYPEMDGRVDVFHNMINVDGIKSKALLKDDCSKLWKEKLAAKKIMLLTVGRLTAQKALDVSIRACKKLIDMGLDVCWFVLGEGDLRGELEAEVKRQGLEEVFFMPGVTTNPYAYLNDATIYVHCSRFEGKSIAIQEAQVLGKPIVVSDCSGNREQVTNGEDGLMCNLGEQEIADNIKMLIDSAELREKLGSNAIRRISSGENMLDKLLKLC